MTNFNASDASLKLVDVLDRADADGEVRIKRPNGSEYIVRVATRSPLDVGYINLKPPLTTEEILQAVREGRERG